MSATQLSSIMPLPDIKALISQNNFKQMAIDQLHAGLGLDNLVGDQADDILGIPATYWLIIALVLTFGLLISTVYLWYMDMAVWNTWLAPVLFFSYPACAIYAIFDSDGASKIIDEANNADDQTAYRLDHFWNWVFVAHVRFSRVGTLLSLFAFFPNLWSNQYAAVTLLLQWATYWIHIPAGLFWTLFLPVAILSFIIVYFNPVGSTTSLISGFTL